MNTNILITSAGKRVTLIELFKDELKKYYPSSCVFTTDMNPMMAPAGYISDFCFKVPKVTDENYLDLLIDICKDNQIGMVIPTIDTELLLLSKNKSIFKKNGIEVIISDFEFVAACRDKRKTYEIFNSLNIRTPEPRDKKNPTFPMFAKPYDGSLSKDLYIIKKREDLTTDIIENPKLIFMEYIDKTDYKEFTVDMYYGKDNNLKCLVPRERIEIRAGEINKGCTRKNYLLNYLKERMYFMPGVKGCICLQLFYRKSDNDVVGIEINPRFGGGYPMSYQAGANFPAYLISEYFLKQEINYTDQWNDNILSLRYDKEIAIKI